MRPVDFRIAAIAAVALLAVAPVQAAEPDLSAQYLPNADAAPQMATIGAEPLALADTTAGTNDTAADFEKMAAKMADPRMQNSVAAMVEKMANSMMNLPIGKLATAIEKVDPKAKKKGRGIKESDTLASLAGKKGEDMPEQLAQGTRQMMTMFGGFAQVFGALIPEFEKMGDVLEDSIKDIEKTPALTN